MVAASRTEAATPSVPLARMFQAPQSPGSLSAVPRMWTRGPVATNGIRTAKATNGTSMSSRLSRNPAGTRAAAATAASSSAYRAKVQTAVRGVATTVSTKQSTAAILQCGGRACTGECPCR